jgi:hypothetical protein
MGSISVACYNPVPVARRLAAEGPVTDRASIVMRAAGGTVVHIFERVFQNAAGGAQMFARFEPVTF